MRLVYPDSETILDFVVPTLDEARAYIRDGAINGQELLEDAGLGEREAKRELKKIKYAMLPGTLKQTFKDES
ncbi:MAG TPA: hypothetical protein VII01_01785 [Solirubrobacteraceae bacterium]